MRATGDSIMKDVLKAGAALLLICAGINYAAKTVVSKALANAADSTSGFKFESKPLEFPEFKWDATMNVGMGNWQGPGMSSRSHATGIASPSAVRARRGNP